MIRTADTQSASFLSARQVCAALDIQPATLYSYVSRGLIRSEETKSTRRERRYAAEDVARLIAKKQNRRDPDVTAAKAARESLKWGVPVMESTLTLIQDGRVYYRGRDAVELARENSFEDVAMVLWSDPSPLSQGRENKTDVFALGRTWAVIPTPWSEISGHMTIIDRMIDTLTGIEQRMGEVPMEIEGARLIWSLTLTAGTPYLDAMPLLTWVMQDQIAPEEPIAELLARMWSLEDARLIDAALILCADHELNASAFAVRVAASTDADLPHALIAGLATLSGGKHGGATAHTRALITHIESPEQARGLVTAVLNRGERVPGFGHHLYPHGDPRGRALLQMIRDAYRDSDVIAVVDAICAAMLDLTGLHPNIDLALSALELAADLPESSALALFALGRSAGWIAHAMEQYAEGTLIRPRAAYVGKMPSPPASLR